MIAYKSTIMGISGRSEKLEPLLSKMSDTALAELRTTMELPRILREMMSSPAVENDTQVSAESRFQWKVYTKLARPIPTLHMHVIARKIK